MNNLAALGLPERPLFWHLKLTGLRPNYDNIHTITIYFQTEGFEEWHIKVFIFDTNEKLKKQSILEDLIAQLQDHVIISNNARYYLSFFKNLLKQHKIDWKPKIICLDRLKKALGEEPEKFVLYNDPLQHCFNLKNYFFKIFYKNNSDIIKKVLKKLIKHSNLPKKMSPDFMENIPKSPGVYLFYDENNILIYIGKSICLRERIQSHWNSVDLSFKEMQLTQQVQRIEWQETVGELGALLLESKWVKQYLPIYNRRLRKTKTFYTFQLIPSFQQYLQVKIISSTTTQNLQNRHSYGFIRRKSDAIQFLKKLIKEKGLCGKWLGLNPQQKFCFYYQIKQCRGACAGLESYQTYNDRLIKAMEATDLLSWPYSGAIALTEKASDKKNTEYHIIYQWKYLISVRSLKSFKLNLDLVKQTPFDYDIYRLIQQALTKYEIKKVLPISLET